MNHDVNRQCVLVIGGTGMLRSAVRGLVGRGDPVIAVARRPQRGAPDGDGTFIPVEGDWSRPDELVDGIRGALDAHGIRSSDIAGAIVWVHSPYRQPVLDKLEGLLPLDAIVLQLWGSGFQDPREVAGESVERPWIMRHLFLGYQRDSGVSRWLTDDEISEATVQAWDGANDRVIAGHLDPWDERP
ncbi:MAG: hypothetical protein ACTH1D_05555 [Mycobacteriaceae bacterium]|uniref:hypothetical protein n=1 Tax=Corynebacterium sp. TaxID=1720 RepID=UPI003F956B12